MNQELSRPNVMFYAQLQHFNPLKKCPRSVKNAYRIISPQLLRKEIFLVVNHDVIAYAR